MLDAVTATALEMALAAVLAAGASDALGGCLDFALDLGGDLLLFRIIRSGKGLVVLKSFFPIHDFAAVA